jgi:type I pantothenate kinase
MIRRGLPRLYDEVVPPMRALPIEATEAVEISPYLRFSRTEWANLRASTPLPLTEKDLSTLRGINEDISLDEVAGIYLPLSRLLNLYVSAIQSLHKATDTFLGHLPAKVPYIIGIAGSVAVGKSTMARILQALLSRWPDHPKVDLITTDGFLYPTSVLEKRGLMNRKGFPESYDQRRLVRFLTEIKSGKREVPAPVYSHLIYDIVPGVAQTVCQPDVLIVEGLNVLQSGHTRGSRIFVSDFFDFSIYIDADEKTIEHWYVARFLRFRETVFRNPDSYFHRYSKLTGEEATEKAHSIWREINGPNLRDNIQPTRERAQLILRKGAGHSVEEVRLRKL